MNPPVDPQAIAALRELSPDQPEFLKELIGVFLDDTPQRISELAQAIASRDATLLTRGAHSIKGSCGNFGATDLAAIALRMEEQGKAADFAAAATTLPALRVEYDRVAAALREAF